MNVQRQIKYSCDLLTPVFTRYAVKKYPEISAGRSIAAIVRRFLCSVKVHENQWMIFLSYLMAFKE